MLGVVEQLMDALDRTMRGVGHVAADVVRYPVEKLRTEELPYEGDELHWKNRVDTDGVPYLIGLKPLPVYADAGQVPFLPAYMKADQVPMHALKNTSGQDVGIAIEQEKNLPAYQRAAERTAFLNGGVLVGVRVSKDGKGFYVPYRPTPKSTWQYAKVKGGELGILLASSPKFQELAKPFATRGRSALRYGSVSLITDRPPRKQALMDVAKGLESTGMGKAEEGGPAGNVRRVNISLD